MDRNMNNLLKWSIENSSSTVNGASNANPAQTPTAATPPGDNRQLMEALFGGPSEADLMTASMGAIRSADPEISLESRLVAFDNFEQLIESLDNANNLENLSLWDPLLQCLAHDEREFRRMAAWCIGTAVQNNARTQDRLHALGGIPPLVGLALNVHEHDDVKKKAVYAISSAVRNHQPSMDACLKEITKLKGSKHSNVDATDMTVVDQVIDTLRRPLMS